jgi:ubiquinone/menaquinone biosynthesis C-methylase UbiE
MENWVPDPEEYREFYADFLRYYFHYTPFKPTFLIDIGCGNYFWRRFRKLLHCFYVGVDPVAKLATGEDYIVTPELGEHTTYPAAGFDVAWLISVMDHVVSEHVTLWEARRLLRPGGIIWIVQTVFKKREQVDGNYAKAHMRFFTRKTLLALVGTYFEVLKVFKRKGNSLYIMAKKKWG